MVRRTLLCLFATLQAVGGAVHPVLGQQGAPQVRMTGAVPTPDSLHSGDITEVRLRFSAAVPSTLTAVTVLGPSGSIPPTGPAEAVPGSNGEEVSIHFAEPLPAGSYTVEWRTAAADGSVVRGTYGFSVSRPTVVAGARTPSGAQASDTTDTTAASGAAPTAAGGDQGLEFGPGGLALNWIFLLSIVGLVGTSMFRLGVAAPLARREDLREVSQRISRRLVRVAWFFAALGLVAVPARLAYRGFHAAGPGGDVPLSTLMGTIWGSAWLLELASVALFLVALLLMGSESRRGPWILGFVAALLGAVVPGMSGHAASGGVVLITVNTVHVLAAGTWAGGLVCLVVAGIPAATSSPPEAEALSAVAAAFSRLALPSVALLVLSGVFNASSHLHWGQMLSTSYGRLLSVKLIIVVAAFALGFYNWRMVRPALRGRPRSGLLSVPATLELVVALCVLAVTSALIVTALP